jgi:hypothetical protein
MTAMVVVDILAAIICFTSQPGGAEECHPVLVGQDTPRGTFTLNQRLTDSPGYGGDVLQFKDDPTEVFAIHRVWLLKPSEKRAERLRSSDPKVRKVTKGCINVEPVIYERLRDCCSRNGSLVIR